METVKPTIFYTVDEEGTILDIGGDWQAFIDKGGVEDPQSMADYNMVGKNLFDFIANETVRDMYRELHRKAMNGQKCEFEYRCDGPDVARVAKLELKAGELGICYTSTILNEVPHNTEVLFQSIVRKICWYECVQYVKRFRFLKGETSGMP